MHWCPMCDNPFGTGNNDCHCCEGKSEGSAREATIVEQAEQVYQQMASVAVGRINVASGEDVCPA